MSRWRQGDINIVVNSDKEGFAHSFNITHGASVVRRRAASVDDAAGDGRARRQAARHAVHARRVGPGELNIPAVRGLGGSLLYFVDDRSELGAAVGRRFRADRGRSRRGAGLMSVDHVSQSMQYEEMLTWLLFYTSLLDVAKTPVAGRRSIPAASCRARSIERPTARLRLVLNASQSRRTLSARFLTDFFGSGVQHIALATDDIFAAAGGSCEATASRCCRSRRTTTTTSRRAPTLRAEEIARLREHNILYDREGDGRVSSRLYTRDPRGRLLLRDRRSARLYRLRRRQRADPPCRADTARSRCDHAPAVTPFTASARGPA